MNNNIYQLHRASNDGNVSRVKFLLASGLDPNAQVGHRETPLMLAAMRGHLSVVKLLLHHGADPTAVNNHGESVLDCAAWAVRWGGGERRERARKVVKYLVEEAGLPVSNRALRYVARHAAWWVTGPRSRILRNFVQEQEPQPTIGQ